MIKNKLLKNTNENEIHANFKDENNILANLITCRLGPFATMVVKIMIHFAVSHLPQTIRIGSELSRKLNRN